MNRIVKMRDMQFDKNLFVESGFDEDSHTWQIVADALDEGWDIVAVDSFHELQGVIKEEENITNK